MSKVDPEAELGCKAVACTHVIRRAYGLVDVKLLGPECYGKLVSAKKLTKRYWILTRIRPTLQEIMCDRQMASHDPQKAPHENAANMISCFLSFFHGKVELQKVPLAETNGELYYRITCIDDTYRQIIETCYPEAPLPQALRRNLVQNEYDRLTVIG